MSDTPRFLHRRSQYGYTDRPDLAMFREPEAISREDQLVITARAHRTAHQLQVVEWQERRDTIARQLDWLYSQRLNRDVREQVRRLQRQLDGLDRKIAAG